MFNLFKKKPEVPSFTTYPLGGRLPFADTRAIPFVQVSSPLTTAAPEKFMADIAGFPHLDQGNLGTCVAHAVAFSKMILDKIETGQPVIYSRRFIYSLGRKFGTYDNDSDQAQGLFPDDALKVITAVGTIKDDGKLDDNSLTHQKYINDFIPTDQMRKEANLYRAGGFASVQVNVDAIIEALLQKKHIVALVPIDWGRIDIDGTLHTPDRVYGYHEVTIIGYDKATQRFIFQNWWKDWGTVWQGFIPFSELPYIVLYAQVMTDIPNTLLERAKNTQYVFLATLRMGMVGDAVRELQKRLKEYGVFTGITDGRFGLITKRAVESWQRLKGLDADGIFGPKGRSVMNSEIAIGKEKAKIDLWCEIIAKIEKAKPELNNPGNIKYFKGTKTAEKAVGIDYRGFCIYPDFETGYMVLRDLLVRAASGRSSSYLPTMTMREFYGGIPGTKYSGYAPASDNNKPNEYADTVTRYIGIDQNAPISSLL